MPAQHPKRPPEISELLGVLARHGVRYVLTGSVAALAYGVDIGQGATSISHQRSTKRT